MPKRDLLIEIGLEELPAGYLRPALEDLRAKLLKELDSNLIDYEYADPLGTPRRLALLVDQVAEKGEARTELITGPPRKAGFDQDGRPTKAALGFAKGQGVEVDRLQVVETERGEYLALEKDIPGQETAALLSRALPGIISSLTFPKSMSWGRADFRFARPIHWLVVLLGQEVVPMELAGQVSGRTSFGHRFMAPGPIELKRASDYIERLAEGRVIVDLQIRRDLTRQAAETAARSRDGRILTDEKLVAINANLVELPSAVCGEFDPQFLELPPEVLITAMREHQKYFAVTDKEGDLLPLFVAINNTLAKNPDQVRLGHQRVLRARLADAAFFFNEDTKKPLKEGIEALKRIVYHKQLGTSYDKVSRFAHLAQWLASYLGLDQTVADKARDAAWLAKADLPSAMVGEFPTLQGAVGRAYALKEGLDPEVAEGIRDHYRPVAADGAPPRSLTGALVGVADRADTLAGMFAIGKPPTGTADPFGLRRAALGVIRILIDRGWPVSLSALVEEALTRFSDQTFKQPREEAHTQLLDYFKGRMHNLFTGQGFDHDVVDAVLAVQGDDPAGVLARLTPLQRFKEEPAFKEGAVAFKRVFNILKGQAPPEKTDPNLFRQPEEGALHQLYLTMAEEVDQAAAAGDFDRLLSRLAGLKPAVDALFDEVMVMAEEKELRANRLALVNLVADLFRQVADFSRLQTP